MIHKVLIYLKGALLPPTEFEAKFLLERGQFLIIGVEGRDIFIPISNILRVEME